MIFSSSLLLTHLSYRPALFKASKKNLICLLLLKAGKNFSNAANRSMDVMCECCLPRIQSCPRTSGCTVTLSHRQHDASSDSPELVSSEVLGAAVWPPSSLPHLEFLFSVSDRTRSGSFSTNFLNSPEICSKGSYTPASGPRSLILDLPQSRFLCSSSSKPKALPPVLLLETLETTNKSAVWERSPLLGWWGTVRSLMLWSWLFRTTCGKNLQLTGSQWEEKRLLWHFGSTEDVSGSF